MKEKDVGLKQDTIYDRAVRRMRRLNREKEKNKEEEEKKKEKGQSL